jgi:hypothetical protein
LLHINIQKGFTNQTAKFWSYTNTVLCELKWLWNFGVKIGTAEDQRIRRNTCPVANMSTTNLTWNVFGLNLFDAKKGWRLTSSSMNRVYVNIFEVHLSKTKGYKDWRTLRLPPIIRTIKLCLRSRENLHGDKSCLSVYQ